MASTVTCEFVLIGTERERQAKAAYMKSHFVITNEKTAMIAGKSHLNPKRIHCTDYRETFGCATFICVAPT